MSFVSPAVAWEFPNPLALFAPSRCEQGAPDLSIVTREASIRLSHALDSADLEQRARSQDGVVLVGWTTNGLTAASVRTEGDSIIKQQRLQNGTWCASLAEAHFTIAYDEPIEVFVSRRYPKGSCEYEAVLAHEREHVAIYAETLRRHLKGAAERVTATIVGAAPAVARSDFAAREVIERRVNAAVLAVTEEAMREARAKNAALDTVESYRAIQAQCENW